MKVKMKKKVKVFNLFIKHLNVNNDTKENEKEGY